MCEKLPLVKLRAIEPEDLDILYGIENDMSLWNDSITSCLLYTSPSPRD